MFVLAWCVCKTCADELPDDRDPPLISRIFVATSFDNLKLPDKVFTYFFVDVDPQCSNEANHNPIFYFISDDGEVEDVIDVYKEKCGRSSPPMN